MKETTMTDPLLLDQFLPAWDHESSMSQLFRAPPAEVFDAVTNLDLFRLPVARVLLGARALPGRLASAAARRHGQAVVPEPPTFRVRDLPARRLDPAGRAARHRAGLRRGRPAVEGNRWLAAGAPR